MVTQLRKLNDAWNAEPNAPEPTVQVEGTTVGLMFLAVAFSKPS